MSAKARKRARRRDRRKAKASGFSRGGKTSMGSRVGHGNTGLGHGSSMGLEPGREPKPSNPIRDKYKCWHRPFEVLAVDPDTIDWSKP